MYSSHLWAYLLAVLMQVSFVVPCIAGQKSATTQKNEVKKVSSRPICGLYCLWSVMKLAKRDVNFIELLKPQYAGSPTGSSLEELRQAAQDHNMQAVALKGLTSRSLRESSYPIILHVRSAPHTKEYDHFELFLGTVEGKARIFNPPEPIRLVPFNELTPRWDGNALVVSADPIDVDAIVAPVRKRLMAYIAFGVGMVLVIHWLRSRWRPASTGILGHRSFGLPMTQCIGFFAAALLVGVAYHFADDDGFVANANATSSIEKMHWGNLVPKVGTKEVGRLLNTGTVFIDARYSRDYAAGHLQNAINIPVNASDEDRHKTMSGVAKDANLVIYCQSSKCKYAEKVGVKLGDDGFKNISIFKGGWMEWSQANANKQ